MKHFPSFRELDAVGEAYAADYLKKSFTCGSECFDIDGFVRALGYNVIYEDFAEEDRNRNGFCGDGVSPLSVWKDNRAVRIIYPKRTIVLDRYLLRPGEETKRRFTLAHEIGHPILAKMTGMDTASGFHTEFDSEQPLTPETIKKLFSMNETCANRLGAAILMPRFMVMGLLKKYNNGQPIRCYDGGVFASEDRRKVQMIADCMKVSFAAFTNRLRELKLLDCRPIEEYIAESLRLGESI